MMFRFLFRIIIAIYTRLRSMFCKRFNLFLFWLSNVDYGRNLCVYDRIYLNGQGVVKIGDDFLFSSGGGINPICRNIRGMIYTMTSTSKIEIGDRVGISSSCLWSKTLIKIGNDVKIGGDCIIIDNDAHPLDYLKRRDGYAKEIGWEKYVEEDIPSAPIYIDDDVWIGARCQILKGVHVGARSIIAAGSVVTKDIPADVIAGGNPCQIIRKISLVNNDR